ncbi:M24 family metallopeptidase [Vagococcus hydrophili]|uniref:Aminopeptidase P family protein n=1 Tax=Vagococcus hydrophili TaxID=2714947 RepID=A0A6G8AR22_9ENTE|nr:aminopeptidase P family protein [Vagococcus hydrophili]QIL47514.1 aminopeptidase P family protein [Vagococcus hydrophili]
MYKERLENVLKEMEIRNMPQLIVSDPMTIFYLTGKMIEPGERLAALVLKENREHVAVINKLFPIPASDLGMPVVKVDDIDEGKGIGVLADQLNHDEIIAVDKHWAAEFLLGLMKKVGKEVSHFALSSEITDDVRAIKSEDEKQKMREVSRDNDTAVGKLADLVPEKLTELAMTEKLATIYKELGNSGFSFDPIVAYGANGADPHHMNDDSIVTAGDSIIIDIGGMKNGYCSDMTRTFFYKEVSDKSREVYETVLEANKRAIEKVKPGVTFAEIDAAARDYITEKGYGEYFTHRTGHFIGMECHEAGDVSGANHTKAKVGNIFSIEPGIYVPGEVGVRIEDLVIVTEDGCENLNHYPKELTILG